MVNTFQPKGTGLFFLRETAGVASPEDGDA